MAFTMHHSPVHGLAVVAGNPVTPRSELVRLAVHRSPEVRAAVAARRDCPFATMLSLVHDESAVVLESLASNPSAPMVVLEALGTHRREAVRLLATRRIRMNLAA